MRAENCRRPEPIERFCGSGPGLRRGDAWGEQPLTSVFSSAAVAAATLIVTPDIALADSAIDAAVKPYFVLGGWLAALVFLSVGSYLLSKAMRYRRLAEAADRWPIVQGTVIAADVIKRISKSDDEFDSYIPRVSYAYTVNGVRREGDVIRIGLDDLGYPKDQQARDHMARYPVGATTVVHYDPQKPEQAVLETGQVGAGRKLFAGAILAGLGLAAIVFAIWSMSLPVR